MSGQFHIAQFPPGCVGTTFRLSGGGAARKRRRRAAPPRHHAAASRRTEIRTEAQDQHPPATFLPDAPRWSPAPCPLSSQGVELRSTPVDGSTAPFRQRNRGAAWSNGPGSALPRGPSRDGLKTDSTVERGRVAKRCESTLTNLSAHESWRANRDSLSSAVMLVDLAATVQ